MARRNRVLAGIALVALTACGGDTTVAPQNYVGTYTALRVNGQVLPAAVDRSALGIASLVQGTLRINADGTWRFDQVIKYTPRTGSAFFRDPPASDAGTYTVGGSELRFVNPQPNGDPFTATVTTSGLTWTHGLMVSYPFQTLDFARQ